MNKSYRQGQILKLIRSQAISTQDELAHGAEGGRHRRHAGDAVARHPRTGPGEDAEGYQEMAPQRSGPDLATILAEFLQDVRVAQNLLVLKTSPGHASSVAVALDNEEWPEVVGTIAGDDTILVITPDKETAATLQGKLLGNLGE